MKWLSARRVLGFTLTGIALVSLSIAGNSRPALGQDEKSGKDRADQDIGTIGADQCARCHSTGRLKNEIDRKLDTFIWMKEFPFWEAKDIHRNAYDCLSGPLGKQMGEILKYDVTKAKACLVCHSVDTKYITTTPRNVKLEDRFYTEYGMSCEACHGAANVPNEKERSVGWFAPHQLPEWRKKTPGEKVSVNLFDMRHPQVRAEKCASCHVGNSGEEKVVTHDMFAAGHPPLQPLEIVTFADQEPAHWFPGRKNEFLNKLAEGGYEFDLYKGPTAKGTTPPEEQKKRAAESYYFVNGESKDVRDMVIGLVATLKSNVKLIREESDKAVEKQEMLDFTHFDCWACHHDLKIPAGRQARGYPGTPGRPLPKPWTNEVLRSVVGVWIKEKQSKVTQLVFDTAMKEFNTALVAKPFGLPTGVKGATEKFEGVLDSLLAEMNVVQADKPLFDAKFVQALAAELLAKFNPQEAGKQGSYIDYEVAQLYGWVFKLLASEASALKSPVPQAEALAKKFDGLKAEKGATPKLLIQLREEGDKYVPIADRLKPRMESLKNFDSLKFRESLGK